MPRACSVCAHDEAHLINVELVSRVPYRAIERRFGVGRNALKRHSEEHIPKLLVEASRAVAVADADDLLSRLEALQSRTLAVLEAVEGSENYATALAAIREARHNLELIGRVTKELDTGATLNLHLSPEWIELRAVIVGSLEGHPAARESVLRAIEGVESGRA